MLAYNFWLVKMAVNDLDGFMLVFWLVKMVLNCFLMVLCWGSVKMLADNFWLVEMAVDGLMMRCDAIVWLKYVKLSGISVYRLLKCSACT